MRIVRSPAKLVAYNPSFPVTGQDPDKEASITVTSPNGGEDWDTGTTHDITWTSVSVTGNVKIELYKDGSLDSTLSSDTANTGSYSWAISSGLADGTDYRIRVTSLNDTSIYDESNSNFTVAAPASITVTSPDGGEDWDTGTTHDITWSSVNVTGNVKIELYKDGSLDSILSSDTSNNNTFSWTISPYLVDGTDYRVRITSLVRSSVYDESDADFTIAEPASITVTSPDGGEDWLTGSTHNITWSSVNVTGNVKIQLYKDGNFDFTLTSDTANNNSYSWAISSGLAESTVYKIRITSLVDTSVYDESDANFTLTAPASIAVTAPDGGEDWDTGTTQSITWSSVNVTGNVKIELYKGGSLDSTLTSNTANNDSYSWAISSGLADGTDYRVRITSLVDTSVYDESDANFTLAAPSTITVASPDGGEDWLLDTAHDITWSSVNVTGNVKIELYKGGSLDSTLTSNTANDDSYSWAISSELFSAATDYKIRITSLVDTSVYDESATNFTLAEPASITVTSPDGGEDWDLGSTHNITWTSVSVTGTVKLELYKGGVLGGVIASGQPNTNTYSWAISSAIPAATDYKVRITSESDGTVYDESDANFTLAVPASITVTAPDGGEDWDTGTTQSITWSSVSVTGNVKIELYKGGSLDSTLTSDTANTNSYSWAISSSLAGATDYKIRITSLVDTSVYDESDANFTLSVPASITVASPDGGEDWTAGTTHNITWTSVSITGNVKIALYKDGSLDSTLTSDTANNDTYSWAISSSQGLGTDYKIRITSLNDTSIYDESDENFSVVAPASITVTSPDGGEDWDTGSTHNITWSSVNVTGNVKILLYQGGGWAATLTSDTANTGTYSWAISSSLTAATDYTVKVISLVDTSVYDESDANFTLSLPASITVTDPDGNEDWTTGTTHNITWTSVNVTGNVKIQLYKGGSLDSTLTSDTANSDTYSWAISSGLAAGIDYKIRITSLADGTVYDESDANFTLSLPASITVASPDGGEDWTAGTTHNITWTSVSITGNVKIALYKGGSLDSTLTSDTANNDTYSWAISSSQGLGTDYKIRITSLNDTSIYDESDENFSVVAPASITVTDPDGGEDWDTGSTHNITWSSVNVTGNVKIELYKDSSLDSTLTSDTANTNTYSWAISSSLTAATDYRVRITSLVDTSVYDESDANFTLSEPASITVTDPDGGEDWDTGTTHNITWTSVNVTGNVKIELYKDGSLDSTLSSAWAGGGPYSWAISSGLAAGTDYRVRITSLVDTSVYDESDANFTLSVPASITVTSPDGGEDWTTGTTHNITWSSVNVTGALRIYVYKGGSYDSTLSNATANDNIFSWVISSSLAAGTDYKIRIESVDDSSVYDESDANFTLTEPASITVTDPDGGEDWDTGSTHNITWSSVNVTGNVKILLYKDSSLDSTLTSDTANNDTYSWAISSGLAAATDYKIRIISLVDTSVYDESDANFTLSLPASITVTAPDGGEDWDTGTTQSITWTSVSVTGNVKIELYKDDSLDSILTSDTANSDTYSWAISSSQGLGTDYKIRITSLVDTSVYDESDADFTIAAGGSYSPPAVTSGLVVQVDAADPDSYVSSAPTVWTNVIGDVDGALLEGATTPGGAVFTTAGEGSLQFDGVDDSYKLVRDNSDLDSGFTVVYWVRPQEVVTGSNSYGNMFNFGQNGQLGWVLSNNKLMAYGFGTSGYAIYAGAQKTYLNDWNMIAWVNQNDGVMDGFVNNIKATSPPSDFDIDTAPPDDYRLAALGTYYGLGYNIKVTIAQALVYDRALTDTEIGQLWDGDKARFNLAYEAPAVTSGLVVSLDVANPDSYDVADPTVWTNTIDDVEAALINGPVFDIEKGGTLAFDGTNDYASLVRDNSDLTDGFSVVMWVKLGSMNGSGQSDQGWILNFGTYNPEFGVTISRCAGTLSGLVSYGFGSGWSNWCDTRIVVDEWYMFVWVNQDDGDIDAWVNGVKDSTAQADFDTGAPSDNFYFASQGYFGGNPLNIRMSQVLVYDRSLTDAEVTSLWEGDQARFGLSPAFTLTSPVGGEDWTMGQEQTITWTSTSIIGNVKIDLYKDGSLDSTLSSSEANTGTYSWDISCLLTGAEDYKIRITSVSSQGSSGIVYGESEFSFTIVEAVCYQLPAVTSGLIVLLDPANSESYDVADPTVWTNTIDDVEGVLINGPTFDRSVIGNIQFDGSNDYASLVRDNSDLTDGFTVVLWFNAQSLAASGYSNEGWLINFGMYSPEFGMQPFGCSGSTPGIASYGYGSGVNKWCDIQIAVDTWYQAVWRNNDDGTIDAWVNNQKDSTAASGYSTTAPGDNFYFASEGTGGNHPIETKIAQVLVYDRSLTDAEVGQLWDGDKARFNLAYKVPAVTSGLVVSLDVANSASYDVADPTVWTNVIDDVEADLINGPTFDIEKGGCLQFDGSNDYASLVRDNSDLTDGWSVVMWFKTDSMTASGYSNQAWLANFGGGDPSLGYSPVWCTGSLSGVASYGGGVGQGLWCDTRIEIDTWYQFVWVNHDDGTIDAYVNSVKDTDPPTGFSTDAPSDNFYLASEGSSGGNPLETKLAQFLVYDRALTDAEVGDLYDGDKLRFGHGYQEPPVTSGMIVKLDVADPNSYHSSAPTVWTNTVDGTDATLINGPAFDPENLGSLVLDGSNDYVELDRDNSALVDGWSVVMWIKPVPSQSSFPAVANWFATFESYQPTFIIQHTAGTPASSGFQTYGYPSGYGTFYDGTTKFAVNEWRQLVLVNRNDGTMDCYINNDKDTGAKTDYSEDTAPSDKLWIGTYNTYTFFEMNIAQLLMYDRPLTDAEVEDLFNNDKRRFGL